MPKKIDLLMKDYFQKSKPFLFPALNVPKPSVTTPFQTYLCWKGKYKLEDYRLICLYQNMTDHVADILEAHPFFVDCMVAEENDDSLFVFDMTAHKADVDMFVAGKYSHLSEWLKTRIRMHFGEESGEYVYMSSYLYPRYSFDTYAELLNVPVEILRNVGELCNPPDLEKECVDIVVKKLEKSRISL